MSVFAHREIRVLVAEAHKRGTEGACSVVQADPRLSLVACVSNAAEAVATALERMPSVCVIDSNLPFGGLTAALEIGARLPTAGLVVRHGPRDDDLFEALHAGVTAYLPRTAPSSRLLRAIVNVAAGEAVLSGTQVARVLEAVRDPARARRRVAGRPGAHRARVAGARAIAGRAHHGRGRRPARPEPDHRSLARTFDPAEARRGKSRRSTRELI